MAPKTVINVKCPCCKSVLEIEVATSRVLSHRAGLHLTDDAKTGEDGMDVALRQQAESKAKLEDRFLDARKKLDGQSDRLERLFEDARKKAKEAEDDPDPNDPFRGGKIWD